jgi:putative nucleotidyltransferase with HDIG domain
MDDHKRILLVDDEPRVLRGMQRQLGLTPWDWEVVLAAGGVEALDILAESGPTFHVVVTDVRMPGMDGITLLKRVREDYPHLVRVVLSGHVDRTMALRTVGLAHQFISKPSSPEILQTTLEQAFNLRNLLSSRRLMQLVGQMNSLPSVPTMFQALLEEIQLPEANLQKIGEIISQDIGMTAKILQLVNSAFFGLRRRVSNPTQAVSLLGLDTVKALVLSAHVFSQFQGASLGAVSQEELQRHSLLVATLAKRIARYETSNNKLLTDYAFTAGLLHDTGRLVLAANLPDDYDHALRLVEQNGISLLEAEQTVFDATHAEVGAYLLGIWGLPDQVVEAVAYHHKPACYKCTGFCPLIAVHSANALFREHYPGETPQTLPEIDEEFLKSHKLQGRLPHWREICVTLFEMAGV